MKSPRQLLFSLFLLLFTLWQGDVQANPENFGSASIFSLDLSDELFTSSEESPCYPPEWHWTNNITQYSATFEWEAVYGAYYYTIQWRYPGGSWYNVSGNCYQTWINVGNFSPCSNYEWRVKSHCGSGYSSSWCYPISFSTLCDYCPEPNNTYTTNITDHSATLHWTEVWGAQGYTVQIQWPGGSWMTIAGSPCQTNWINVNNLQPGTSYDWRVRANCGYNNYSDWAYGWFATDQSYYCHYPQWQHCYNITGHSATWQWESVYGADYYHIQWCTPGGTWYDLSGGWCYSNWVYVNHLNPCTNYQWRVRSYCHYGGWSDWCYPHNFTTTCHYSCPVPTSLYTTDIGDTKATLKWSPVYGASSYTLQVKDLWGNWYNVPGSPTSGTWITVYNLTPCKTYEWRIRANCQYESYSSWSQPKQFTTTCGHSCHAPQWVYTNGITTNSASLHWAPVSGADYYVVEWRTPNGTWYEMQGGPWSNTWTDITGLLPNTTYEWRVKAHCVGGQFSGWSSITHFTTLGHSCGMPMFRYTLPITESTATFNWSAVPDAVNYTVQIRLLNGTWSDVPGSPTTGTSITATGLLPNTMYEWRMQVNCSNGAYSPWLSAVMFQTGGTPACATPHTLFADNITLNSAILHWSHVPGAESYSVEIRLLPHGAWNPVVGSPVDTNFVFVDGLIAFASYEWRVRANCAGGQHSFWTAAVHFTTTNAPPCNPPANLSASSLTETTATLSWSPVAGALGYQAQIRLPNGIWLDLPGGTLTDTFTIALGLTPHTTYEWRVRTQCDSLHFSHWSAGSFFTTAGTSGITNDECSNATLLTVESSCVATFASNIDATPSSPPPSGGCWSNGYRDVWFKFTMPDVANPTVTIRTGAGSLANAVMEVYSGTDCSILSLVACEDNNDNGNGSSMPVINLTGTANTSIWVRVWGFDGSTGTFTICVFNYISFNSAGLLNLESPEASLDIDVSETFVNTIDRSAELHVSPNPVSDLLKVSVWQTEQTRVVGLRVIDMSGKIMLVQKVDPSPAHEFETDVDVSPMAPGMYILQVQTTDGIMSEKISVVK